MSKRLPMFRPFWAARADDYQCDRERVQRDIDAAERQLCTLERLKRHARSSANLIACTMLDAAIKDTRRHIARLHNDLHRDTFVSGRLRRLAGGHLR